MRHWIEQAVIGLNLCPFAKSVYVKNQVRIVVSQARNIDAFLDDLDRELELLKDTPAEQVDTTLLVHPTLFPDFFVFNDFLDLVDEVVEEHELEGIVQVAPFHPAFQFEDTEPDDADNLTNRAPYATLHLLREASIDRAVEVGRQRRGHRRAQPQDRARARPRGLEATARHPLSLSQSGMSRLFGMNRVKNALF